MANVPLEQPKRKFDYNLLSVALVALVIIEGAALVIGARQINYIESRGTGLYQTTVMLIGLQLLLLGVVALTALLLNGAVLKSHPAIKSLRSKIFSDRAKLVTIMHWVPAVIGVVVIVEAFVAAYVASPMEIEGIGGVRGIWMALFGAQLFLLGMGMVYLCAMGTRMDLRYTIRGLAFLLIASAGLFIYGIADTAYIVSIGGVRESTVEILGLQLLALAVAALMLMVFNGRSFLGKKISKRQVGKLGVISISVVLCVQGMIITALASNFSIDSIGGMVERTMVIAGISLAMFSLLVPVTYYFMERRDKPMQSLAHSITLFLVFLLPFSLLM